jgi:hypothetical protein
LATDAVDDFVAAKAILFTPNQPRSIAGSKAFIFNHQISSDFSTFQQWAESDLAPWGQGLGPLRAMIL